MLDLTIVFRQAIWRMDLALILHLLVWDNSIDLKPHMEIFLTVDLTGAVKFCQEENRWRVHPRLSSSFLDCHSTWFSYQSFLIGWDLHNCNICHTNFEQNEMTEAVEFISGDGMSCSLNGWDPQKPWIRNRSRLCTQPPWKTVSWWEEATYNCLSITAHIFHQMIWNAAWDDTLTVRKQLSAGFDDGVMRNKSWQLETDGASATSDRAHSDPNVVPLHPLNSQLPVPLCSYDCEL